MCEYPKAQLAKSEPPAPQATISPGYQFWDFTFDSSGNLWVPEFYHNVVVEYTKSELAASRSPTPKVVISQSASANVFDTPTDLAFDSAGDLWVLNSGNQALVEISKAQLAKSGTPTPTRTIAGAATGLNNPQYLAIEP